jgi:DEAD/DEAH box helicase domain-containing protein
LELLPEINHPHRNRGKPVPGTVIFDLETKKLSQEVGGWSNIERMGFAAGVTFTVETNEYARYTEDMVNSLILYLQQADRIIGFNLIGFDYTVLKPYGLQIDHGLKAKSIDLLLLIKQALGFRIGLGNLAEATLAEAKSADGIQSVRWFREGKIEQVLDYCEQDVRVTYQLWRFGCDHGHIFYRDRRGRRVPISVDWNLSART